MNPESFDVIGDVHGELPALLNLGRELGYEVENGWTHPEKRKLIFLGDLVDRGGHSLEVAELVHELVKRGRALCLMGNHEYNLVAYDLKIRGYEKPKPSNGPTIAEMQREPERWRPVLDFFRTLPVALEFPELRLIHACWHLESIKTVERIMSPDRAEGPFAENVVLSSPFDERGLKPGLEADSDAPAQEVLLKGYEIPSEPFRDADDHWRDRIRATWWLDSTDEVATDKPIVVGHYWNLPPVNGEFSPPYPSGHPKLKAWQKESADRVPPSGRVKWTSKVACIDFNGVTAASKSRACVGAVRWPEREIVWASGEKTRRVERQ